MKKYKKSYFIYIIVSIVLLIGLGLIIYSLSEKNEKSFIFPSNVSEAIHYEAGENIPINGLNIAIDELIKVGDDTWTINGKIDKSQAKKINNKYTIMLSYNDIVLQKSMSTVTNDGEVRIISSDNKKFNQVALIDNKYGEVLAVVDFK